MVPTHAIALPKHFFNLEHLVLVHPQSRIALTDMSLTLARWHWRNDIRWHIYMTLAFSQNIIKLFIGHILCVYTKLIQFATSKSNTRGTKCSKIAHAYMFSSLVV